MRATCSACSRRAARVAREAEEARPNTLRISAVTTAGEYLVPQLIQAFRERRPDLEISLDVGNRELVFQRVLDHHVDVAVTGRIPDDERLVGVDFADNEFTIVTAAGDPLARRRWVAMEELASRPWLLREPGSGTRTLVRGVPREPWDRAQCAHARLERSDQAGRPLRARHRASVARGGGARTGAGTARHHQPPRRTPGAPLARGPLRSGPGTRGRGGLHGFCTSPAARHALAG